MVHVYVHENHIPIKAPKEEKNHSIHYHITYSVHVSLGNSYIDDKALCTCHWKDVLAFIEKVNSEFKGKVWGEIGLRTNIHGKEHHNDLILLLDRINEQRRM